jgi:hypothetical protein
MRGLEQPSTMQSSRTSIWQVRPTWTSSSSVSQVQNKTSTSPPRHLAYASPFLLPLPHSHPLQVIALGYTGRGLGAGYVSNDLTIFPGVNAKLLPYFQARKGKRNGIVLLDFYKTVPGLVEAIIGL